MVLNRIFKWLSEVQVEKNHAVIAVTILITLIQIYGASYIYLETNFDKFSPSDLPEIVLKNRVRDTFGGQDTVFILVEVDPGSTNELAVKDIRDPRVFAMIYTLTQTLRDEPSVDNVRSVGQIFEGRKIPQSVKEVEGVLELIPLAKEFFNRDYTSTVMMVSSNIGSATEKIEDFTQETEKDIQETPKPAGIKLSMTGEPSIRSLVAKILIRDAQYTILLASAIILLVLIIINKSPLRGYLIFNPLIFGLIWTIGTMGWMNIPLSMVTAGIGAMILGLGVEYSVFIVTKYEDERKTGRSQKESIYLSLSEVGTAIVGSSTTTIIGFLALLLSIMPMMHDLGFTLALGIFYCVVASLVINPAFIVFEENIVRKTIRKIADHAEEEGK